MRLPFLGILFFGITAIAAAQTTSWDYTGKQGALVWSKLDPAYKLCSEGHEQSPIDIRNARTNKTLRPIEFHYMAGQVEMENNGKTVVVHVGPGSYMIFNGMRYDLVEYEFHHPSETTIKGKLADMEVQLLHKAADGKQVILTIRLAENADAPNTLLSTLWQHLPTKAGTTEKITSMVNTAALLPADRSYLTYMGSLSKPPCTEGIRWFVFENSTAISRTQLRTFGALFKINTRPLQDPHGRHIDGYVQ